MFGEDGLAVYLDVEDSPRARDQLELVDVLFMPRQDLGRQTDGLVRIASLVAIGDGDLHFVTSTLVVI